MKTKMSLASLSAYWRMRDAGELPLQEMKVYHAIVEHGPMTREQIAAKTGMKEGSAAGRVNMLVARDMLRPVGIIINPSTGHTNGILDIAPHRKVAA